ncbi:hypothetical protein [Piscinibacter gummiphilus]|uniref:Uncharacterized protein n=1 Tax=Piscinibacter gummiphilus TaxID=946333 RepID=A0ABZ0D7L2_9BURK|nr:hypothetical protein [Piscinibacter gummiphilus]WOB11262.1 hypothetical protein RXV79_26895 [Piscinibacter gummiphilus]
MTKSTVSLFDACYAAAHDAMKRVHVRNYQKIGAYHAGVEAAVSAVEDARVESIDPATLALRLWALRVLAALRAPWTLWAEGLTDGSSAALHAVHRLLEANDIRQLTAPADADQHPRAVAAEVASALGYKIRMDASGGKLGWRWVHQHNLPVVRTTESALTFGSASSAYRNACEHALDLLIHPTWQLPKSLAVLAQFPKEELLAA